MIGTTIVLGTRSLLIRPITNAFGRTEKFEHSKGDRLLYFGLQPVAENHVDFLLVSRSRHLG